MTGAHVARTRGSKARARRACGILRRVGAALAGPIGRQAPRRLMDTRAACPYVARVAGTVPPRSGVPALLIQSIDAIRRHYSPGEGRHWFDPSSLRFFRCRLSQTAYVRDDGTRAYFVSSERPPSGKRAYTVRCYDFATRNISTVGGFLAFASRSGADGAARRLARGEG